MFEKTSAQEVALVAKSKTMGPKSITNGTNLARGKGYPKINENMKKFKNRKWRAEFMNKSKRSTARRLLCGIINKCDKHFI